MPDGGGNGNLVGQQSVDTVIRWPGIHPIAAARVSVVPLVRSEFLAGFELALAVAYIALGLAFCIGYLAYRREPEHLVFGLRAQALAIYAIGFTFGYLQKSPVEARIAVAVASGGAILGAALMLHFAMLCAAIKNHLVIMRPIYGLMLLLEAENVWSGLFTAEAPSIIPVKLGPFASVHLAVRPSVPGLAACVFIGAGVLVSTALLARPVAMKRFGAAAFVGSALMAVTTTHDVFLAAGLLHGTWLAPFGDSSFIFLVSGSFVVRSSKLSKELTGQSAELRRRSGELRQSYEELREAQRELTRKEQLAAIGELAAVIAHEVRNPLAIISNAVAGLRRREIGHEDRETLLGILKEEAARLNRLVGDLLRYARPVSVQRQLCSVREILDRTLSSAGPRDEVTTEVDEHPDVPGVWGDAGLLRQIFDNLVDNAVQAMATQARNPKLLSISIKKETREGAAGVRVDIRDTGEGMEPHVRQRAMDPFFTTRPSGTGLGLAIVDRIVDAHDGEIWITSTTETGTTVSVFLPVGSPTAPSQSAMLAVSDEPPGDA
jgi:signal transduction histidine kinase